MVDTSMQWDRDSFSYWLKMKRRVESELSQDDVADRIGATQAKISRWEKADASTDPPTLNQCLRLAEVFDGSLLDLARMCGQWNDDLEKRILVELAAG